MTAAYNAQAVVKNDSRLIVMSRVVEQVNDDFVNYGYDVTASSGKIALQAEGTEVELRKVVLTKLED